MTFATKRHFKHNVYLALIAVLDVLVYYAFEIYQNSHRGLMGVSIFSIDPLVMGMRVLWVALLVAACKICELGLAKGYSKRHYTLASDACCLLMGILSTAWHQMLYPEHLVWFDIAIGIVEAVIIAKVFVRLTYFAVFGTKAPQGYMKTSEAECLYEKDAEWSS